MSYISECEFCGKTGNEHYGTRQTEVYDGIDLVFMCQVCGFAAEFEQQRIIKILEEESGTYPVGWNYTDWLIALIKGENK